MGILILRPKKMNLEYSYFKNSFFKGQINLNNFNFQHNNMTSILKLLIDKLMNKCENFLLNKIIIHTLYGGNIFNNPEIVDKKTISKLKLLIQESPIICNLTIELIKSCKMFFYYTPIEIFFDTSFFVDLPEYESLYALENNQSNKYKIKKFGYNGFFHKSVVEQVTKYSKKKLKIISVCLNINPEIVGIINKKPIFTTSGATPIEGLIGEKKCGKLDPGLILYLNKELKWGAEEINNLLLNKSGLYGLTESNTTFNKLYQSNDKKYILIKKMFEYQFLLECGSAALLMNGVDYIIFSGKYCKIGEKLISVLFNNNFFKNKKIKIIIYKKNIDEILIFENLEKNK